MSQTSYEKPLTRIIQVKPFGVLLTSTRTVEQMRSVSGSWDEEDDNTI